MTLAGTRPRRVAGALVALVAWLAVGAGLAAPASAHAVLLASEPADGQELDLAPGDVLLRFSEPVELPPEGLQVFDSGGRRADLGDAGYGPDRTQVRTGLPEDLADGFYTVTWRAVSSDGHPIRGAFTFTVGDPGEGAPVAPDDIAGSGGELGWEVVAALARWAAYAGALLAVGGGLFLLLAHDRSAGEARPAAKLLALAALVSVVATVVGVPVYAVLSTGLGWQALTSPGALGGALASGVGLAALVRVGGLGLVLAGLPRVWTARGGALVVAGGVVALVSFLLSGHTAASEPRALVLGANLVHTGAAAVWFGGLVLLALVLRRGAGGVPAALAGAGVVRRFSSVALVSVAALAVAGLALAWVEVRSLEALVTTAYGWTLLAKVALAGVVVALGAYNRTRLVDRVSVAGERAWATLAATVRVEAAALVAVLGITAVLVALVPARTAAGVGEPFVHYLPLGPDHEVNLVIDPARTGSNEFHLYLLDGAGRLADVGGEVTIRLSLPAAGIAPIEREPFVAGPGHWVHIGSELSIPGAWQVEVQVLVSDFERLTAVTEVDIGGRAR